jgi:hypothetical protein
MDGSSEAMPPPGEEEVQVQAEGVDEGLGGAESEDFAAHLGALAQRLAGLAARLGLSCDPRGADDQPLTADEVAASGAFLSSEGARRLRQHLVAHHEGQEGRLREVDEDAGNGPFFLVCHPGGEEAAYVDGSEGWEEIGKLGDKAAVFSTLLILYFPVALIAFLAAQGNRWCHTCLQMYNQTAATVQRVADACGRVVYLPVMDMVPAVAPAVPGSGKIAKWTGCIQASCFFLGQLVLELPCLQLGVLSTKMGTWLLKDSAGPFDGLVEHRLMRSIDETISGGQGGVTSAMTLTNPAGGAHLLASHPSAKQTVMERAAVGAGLCSLLVRATDVDFARPGSVPPLARACRDLIDVEPVGAAVGAVEFEMEAIAAEGGPCHAALTSFYRKSPGKFMEQLKEQQALIGQVSPVVVQAVGLVLGALTGERNRVMVAVLQQLRAAGVDMSLREVIEVLLSGASYDDRLRRVHLRHPDAPAHLGKTVPEMVVAVQKHASFIKHHGLGWSAARYQYFIIGLLIDTYNGHLGGKVHVFVRTRPGDCDDDDTHDGTGMMMKVMMIPMMMMRMKRGEKNSIH